MFLFLFNRVMFGYSRGLAPFTLAFIFIQAFDSIKCVAAASSIAKFKTEYACEDQIPEIFCPSDHMIKVINAKYGRLLKDSEFCQDDDKLIKECGLSDVSAIVRNMCDGLERCSIAVTNNQLGNMCPGVYKYFNLLYKCDSKPTTSPPPWIPWFPTTGNITSEGEQTRLADTNPTSNSAKMTPDPDGVLYDREMFAPENGGASLSKCWEVACYIGLCAAMTALINVFPSRIT